MIRSYNQKIMGMNHIFKPSVQIYRNAVDFFIDVCESEWDNFFDGQHISYTAAVEKLTVRTAKNPCPKYPFDIRFYKFPCYLRRAAISKAVGLFSSYKSNLKNWEAEDPAKRGKAPNIPKAGNEMPIFYKDNTLEQTGTYTGRIKVLIRNTWDWVDIKFRKSDVDYIARHCTGAKKLSPALKKAGKQWYLCFPFKEAVDLNNTQVCQQKALAVDLGINNACTCSVMDMSGAVTGRYFLKLPVENDCLSHRLNMVKKAQQNGNTRMPRLWASVNGINDRIAVETAEFIVSTAVKNKCSVIVMEHLDTSGKKNGSKRQRIHFWKCQYVQAMVEQKAHRGGIRISRVNARNTSALAYDGSGKVERGIDGNYSICRFKTGKVYNCDLSASYNIGARYFIRAIYESASATERLWATAKVPSLTKRSTCTLSDLINLNAAMAALSA